MTAGLGRSVGLGGAFLATFGYTAIGFFAPPFFAITLQRYVTDNLGGPAIAWHWYALVLIAVTTALAYRRIDLSAKVLTTVMVLEVVVVVVFDILAFIQGGPTNGGDAGVGLPWVADAGIGLAVLFVVGNFLGFEATVIYREEVKRPERTTPLATYIAVGSIGLFYALAAWAYLAHFGADKAQAAAENDTAGMFGSAMMGLTGKAFVDVITVLLMTSIVASALSIQNVASRYLFSLGKDGVLPPQVFGKVHSRHGSPFAAASLIGSVWAVAVVLFACLGISPETLYAKASGSGTFAILVLMFAASVAVVAYFWRNRGTGSAWTTLIAPGLAAVGLGGVTYLAIANYSDLLGDTGLITTLFLGFTFVLPVGGSIVARVLRAKSPEVYQRIGRQKL